MKHGFERAAGLLALAMGSMLYAQTPTGAPAGATGQCKDGTYSMQASKGGACRGHQGVKQWFAMSAATPATVAKPAAALMPVAPAAPAARPAAPAASAAPAPSAAPQKPIASPRMSSTTPAAGGGPGKVWVNSASKVYHCQSDPVYGKTKAGMYESEADAKAAGARPSHGKTCS